MFVNAVSGRGERGSKTVKQEKCVLVFTKHVLGEHLGTLTNWQN